MWAAVWGGGGGGGGAGFVTILKTPARKTRQNHTGSSSVHRSTVELQWNLQKNLPIFPSDDGNNAKYGLQYAFKNLMEQFSNNQEKNVGVFTTVYLRLVT